MMLRKLAISLAIAGALGVTNANALGLGEIKVKSALNEPLSAEIELVQVRTLKPLQIQPRMADVDEFALAGLQRSRFLSNVRFQVQVRPDGTGIVRLTSNEVVREPFLSFLVEINWPNGRLVREYTVLLDPPVFNPAPIRRTVQPVASAQMDVATIRQGQPLDIPARPRKAADNIRSRVKSGDQIYIGVNETLWKVAERNRPGGGITPTQMMVALQRKNPQAFFDNNINRLKAGVVLDLPTLEEARALSHQEAVAEVRRQTRLWKQGKSNKAASAAPKAEPKPAARKVAPQSQKSVGKLTIAAPGAEETVSSAATSGDGSEKDKQIEALTQRNQELQNRLNDALESAESAGRENAQLSKRLDAIDQHLETLQKLLDVKDGEISQLQAALADKEEVGADSGKSILDYLTSPVALAGIGSGLVALLGGALFMLLRRRKNKAEPDESGLVQVPEELKMSAIDEPDGIEEQATEKAAEDQSDQGTQASDMEDLSDLEDVADLDLDMDLELAESEGAQADVADDALNDLLADAETEGEDRLEDLEFDLGLDEETEAVADQIAAETEGLDASADADPLDAILSEADAFDGTDVDAADLDALLDGGLDAENAFDAGANDPLDELGLPEEDIFADLGMDFDDVDSALDEQPAQSSAQDDIDALLSGMDEELSDNAESEEPAVDAEISAQDDIDSLLAGITEDDAEEPQLSAEEADGQDDIDALLNSVSGIEADDSEALLELDELMAPASAADAGDELESLLDAEPDVSASALALEDESEADSLTADLADMSDLDLMLSEEQQAGDFESSLELAEDTDLDEMLSDELLSGGEAATSELESLLADVASDDDGSDLDELELLSVESEEPSIEVGEEDSLSDVDSLLGQVAGESALEPAMDQAEAMSELEALLGSGELQQDFSSESVSDPDSAVSDLEQELAKLSGLELEETGADAAVAEEDLSAFLDGEIVEESADFDTLLAEIAGDEGESSELAEDAGDELEFDLPVAELSAPVATDTGMTSQAVAQELTANIAHDLVADEAGLEEILADSGAAVELEETSLTQGLSYEEVDGWSLLEATNENDTKLDLVRAYIDMDDRDGAREILQEVMNEGSEQQRQDAQTLLQEIG